jgi:DNA polymerase-3 subunit delta'
MNDPNSLPWLRKPFFELTHLNNFPQSLLIYGSPGIGKLKFALSLANFILCESESKTKPCLKCDACHWFHSGNHPDFIGIVPETSYKLLPHDDSESFDKDAGEEKKLSKFIKIDQIREALSGIGLGTYRGRKKVLLIGPIELMQAPASNSLLKSLEEPPENTIFILVSNQLDQVLPTIRSRCRLFNIHKPTTDESIDWLENHKVSSKYSKDIQLQYLRESGGAPLLVLENMEGNSNSSVADLLLSNLILGEKIDALAIADQLSKTPIIYSIAILQRWVYDLALLKQAGKLRYYPSMSEQLNRLLPKLNNPKLLIFNKFCLEAKRRSNHALTVKLQLESLLIQYSKIFS